MRFARGRRAEIEAQIMAMSTSMTLQFRLPAVWSAVYKSARVKCESDLTLTCNV